MLSQCGEWAAMVRVFHRLLSKRPDAIDVIINDGQHNSYIERTSLEITFSFAKLFETSQSFKRLKGP